MKLRTLLACAATLGLMAGCTGQQDVGDAREDLQETQQQAVQDINEAKGDASESVAETRQDAQENVAEARQDVREAEVERQQEMQEQQAERQPAAQGDTAVGTTRSADEGQPQVTREQCQQMAQQREIRPDQRQLYNSCAELYGEGFGN